MAHKKGVGSSKNGRESESKRLGLKLFGGQFAKAGYENDQRNDQSKRIKRNIYIRQCYAKHVDFSLQFL